MKKLSLLVSILAMFALSFVGCANPAGDAGNSNNENNESATTVNLDGVYDVITHNGTDATLLGQTFTIKDSKIVISGSTTLNVKPDGKLTAEIAGYESNAGTWKKEGDIITIEYNFGGVKDAYELKKQGSSSSDTEVDVIIPIPNGVYKLFYMTDPDGKVYEGETLPPAASLLVSSFYIENGKGYTLDINSDKEENSEVIFNKDNTCSITSKKLIDHNGADLNGDWTYSGEVIEISSMIHGAEAIMKFEFYGATIVK